MTRHSPINIDGKCPRVVASYIDCNPTCGTHPVDTALVISSIDSSTLEETSSTGFTNPDAFNASAALSGFCAIDGQSLPNGPPLLPRVVPNEEEKPVEPLENPDAEVVNGDVPLEVEGELLLKVEGAEDCWKVFEKGLVEPKVDEEENGRDEAKVLVDEKVLVCCWKVC